MSNSKQGTRPASRRSRRLAFAVALAVAPAYAFGQELPALPQLPALPALPQASVGSDSQVAVSNFGLPTIDEMPLPNPYPFGKSPRGLPAVQVVRILGLNASQGTKAAEQAAPSLSEFAPPKLEAQPSSNHGAKSTSSLPAASMEPSVLSGTPDLPAQPKNIVLAVRSAAANEPARLATVAEWDGRSEVRAASAEAEMDENFETSFSLSDDPVGEVQESQSSNAASSSRLSLTAAVNNTGQPQQPSLIDLADAAIQIETTPPSVVASSSRPATLSLQGKSTTNQIAATGDATVKAVAPQAIIEAPSLPLMLESEVGLDRPGTTANQPFGDGVRLQAMERSGTAQGETSSRAVDSMPVLSGTALELNFTDDDRFLPDPTTPAAPAGLNQGASPTAFSLSDSDVDSEPMEFRNSDTSELVAMPIPSPLQRSSLVADGLRLSRSAPPLPRPMRIQVEGESAFEDRSPNITAQPSQRGPAEAASPFRLAGSPRTVQADVAGSDGGNARLPSQLISSSTPRLRFSQSEDAATVVSGTTVQALAVEAEAPRLSEASKPKMAITGEMRQVAPLTVDLEDASICQADDVIAELSVEHIDICRLIQTGPKTYSILGLVPGTTRVAVITTGTDGKHNVSISQVTVEGRDASSSTRMPNLAREINRSLTQLYPQYVIDVDVVGKSLLVQGEVGSEAEAKRVLGLIRKASLMPVIDKLRSPEK